MKILFKPSVRIKELSPALLHILKALDSTYAPVDLTITSINDGKHMTLSRHYTNEALDLRAKNFPNEKAKREYAARLREALGPAFTVLYESPGEVNQHFHIQVKKGHAFL